MWLSGLYQLPPFLGDSTVGMIKIFQMITSKPAYLSVWEDVGDLCSRSNFLLHKNIDCKKIYVISKLQLLCLYSLFSLFLRCCKFQWFDTLFVVYWHTTCCVGKRWCWEKYPAGCLDTWWVRQWPWTSKVEPFSTSSRDSEWENVKY